MVLKNSFEFKLGSFKCRVIKDGTLMTASGEGCLKPIMDVLCLLVRTEKNHVLIDSGFGEQPVINGIHQTGVGKLMEILKIDGIKPADIDTVFLSHLHPDHIGGIAGERGNALFPEARYYVSRKEWEFWMGVPDTSKINEDFKNSILKAIQKRVIPVKEKLIQVDEGEIVPGIRLKYAPGHTPGHITLSISSGSEQLTCIFDLLHSPLEFSQPDLFKSSDMSPEIAGDTRENIFDIIEKSGALVFASHFPFPGLGYISRQRKDYSWERLNSRSDKLH